MATAARIGYGTTVEKQTAAGPPAVFTKYPEVVSVDLGDDETEEVDATHMESPDRTREFIPGLNVQGDMSITFNYTEAGHEMLLANKAANASIPHRITLPDGRVAVLPLLQKNMPIDSVEVDGKMTMTATFRKAGAVTWTAAP